MWRIAVGLVLAVLLSACASAPPPPTPPVALQTQSPWRARIAGAALAEWQAWGRPTADGWPEALPQEVAPENYQNILTYWAGVDEGAAVIRRHQAMHDALMAGLEEGAAPGTTPTLPAISLWAHPAWSAAFISHVMARAGVPGFVFPPSAAHAFYIDFLLSQANWNPQTAAFLPHDPAEYAPRPGDLICADRAALRLLHWQDRLSEAGQFRPMHCDVVVQAGPGLVQAIGGNVLDAVVLRRFPADRQGRALPPPPDKPPFIVIFENRMDAVPQG
jgi:hypothetical protein